MIEENRNLFSCKYGIVYIIMAVHFSGLAMVSYITSEYTQRMIRKKEFPNVTFTYNVTDCKVTNHSDPDYIQYAHVQELTSKWTIYYATAAGALAIASNFILTSLTDAYGRKFLFAFSAFGSVLKAALIFCVIYFSLPLSLIVVAYGIEGLTGMYFSFFAVSFAYLADVTISTSQMIIAVTLAEGCINVFSTTGGLLDGILTEQTSFKFVIGLSCGLSLLAFLMIIFFLPETLPRSSRTKMGVLKLLSSSVQFYVSNDFRGLRLSYILLMASFFFTELIANNRSNVEVLYLLGMPFCWSPSKIGYFTSLRFGVQGTFGIVILKVFSKCLTNEVLAISSALIQAGTFIQEALARSEVVLYLITVPAVFSALTIPLIRGIMSSITSSDKQGSLFASIATVEVTSYLVASLSENGIYAATVAVSNSFVFWVMGGFSLIAAIFLVFYQCAKPTQYEKISGNDGNEREAAINV